MLLKTANDRKNCERYVPPPNHHLLPRLTGHQRSPPSGGTTPPGGGKRNLASGRPRPGTRPTAAFPLESGSARASWSSHVHVPDFLCPDEEASTGNSASILLVAEAVRHCSGSPRHERHNLGRKPELIPAAGKVKQAKGEVHWG